jgi:hypothetical protein
MVRVSTSSTDTHSSHIHARSYAVPQGVGKVGTESPTFIEPVQKRKDGIEAMFMRQSKAPKSEPHTPSSSFAVISPPSTKKGKRKRERSPVETMTGGSQAAATSPSAKHVKAEDPVKPEVIEVEDVDASEADSEVEILTGPLESVRHLSNSLSRRSHIHTPAGSDKTFYTHALHTRALQVLQGRRVTPLHRGSSAR